MFASVVLFPLDLSFAGRHLDCIGSHPSGEGSGQQSDRYGFDYVLYRRVYHVYERRGVLDRFNI